MASSRLTEMSTLEFHVLLALADGALYGYAIADVVADESAGTLTPRPGSLYRVLARLMVGGLVTIARTADDEEPHPGIARRYYELTPSGRRSLAAETQRLKLSVRLSEQRLGLRRGHP